MRERNTPTNPVVATNPVDVAELATNPVESAKLATNPVDFAKLATTVLVATSMLAGANLSY